MHKPIDIKPCFLTDFRLEWDMFFTMVSGWEESWFKAIV